MDIKKLIPVLLVIILISCSVVLAEKFYDNTAYDWYFMPSKDNQPARTEPHYEKMLNDHGGYFIGNSDEKELYLTFDNGYENGYTTQILDVLKEKQVPAAFFVTGHYLETQAELIDRMVKEGHIVGNHSWHHPSLVEVDDATLKEELDSVKAKFTEMTGVEEMKYLRPPRGIFSERTLALSNELGYTNVFWSFAYMDWDVNNQKGAQYAYDNIMKRVHPGAIMLLHSISKDNAEALGRVIDELKSQGYVFKTLDDLVK
ncbi:delta-lactam-biosynthetic de-N-acetylase [Alkalicella caledoniensis]|uniref:Delta-lactam-biosynthetic de-N-acetylase n=1 Tax=Alkalicella caledoniensis TaxID=2731377 RepID=A0A7G9W7C8_ALKCA|nr:delta-lactam-biosynthetic de-N-acetylase [Alkalicella caledoniensis]QNO14590.1 delta-lactam-biosynthetic de-N-acetylase [Alkalicella caledoniensis]